jgi:glyoxylase-like metal-dependent hydrolase (beta-lactamase superfamily II)
LVRDVAYKQLMIVNVMFVGVPGCGDGNWVLVDAGVMGSAGAIRSAAKSRFGENGRPAAIVLTHGHFDHVGVVETLAEDWNVPVYAHRLEMPYLTGRSAYPPPDPTIGGAIAFLSRFMPSGARNLTPRIQELQPNEVPGAAGWEWLATPGHSPGHISLFRPSDRVLLAGDAFATMNMDSWSGLVTGRKRLARAGAPFNTDWEATRFSVRELANLKPNVAGCGHGIPRCDADLPQRLERFAKQFRAPRHGRYVRRPARTDEHGIISLPPAPFDPIPYVTAAGLIAMGIALGAGYPGEQRRR